MMNYQSRISSERCRVGRLHPLVIRRVEPARLSDVGGIFGLLGSRAPQTIALEREFIARHIDRFGVIRSLVGEVLACAALLPLDAGRIELRSVAVRRGWEGQGFGRHLLEWAVGQADRCQLMLACVTTCPKFFRPFGFRCVVMEDILHKAGRDESQLSVKRQAMVYLPAMAYGMQEARG